MHMKGLHGLLCLAKHRVTQQEIIVVCIMKLNKDQGSIVLGPVQASNTHSPYLRELGL